MVLEQAGVCEIDISNICTACNLDDWYSHRGEKGKTGRFGVLIGL
ncbi:MAG: laccase domain-containing protein [Anaerolineales bacterium]|nr:laccase domain-containing protein [Anaerolineales bacterium]